MIWPFILLALLLAGSFLASGSETALFALTAQERREFSASSSRFKRLASTLMTRPRRVLMTVLIVNTTVNIAIFAVSFFAFESSPGLSPLGAALSGVVVLLCVIFFGELVPKAVALANARRMAPLVAPFIHVLQTVAAPLSELLRVLLVEPITRLLSPARSGALEVTLEELHALVNISATQGIISSRENEMLQAVVALPDVAVRSVMVPRVGIKALSLAADANTARRIFQETGLKKVPVYGNDLDDIRGQLYARDFYLSPGAALGSLVRPVRYVPENINLLQLIQYFRSTRAQLAVVVDEYGGVSGLVTMEDVLEEIVGELEGGGGPRPGPAVERIDDRTYLIAGSLSVRSWRKALGITGRFTQAETMGGVVLASLGRLPRVGDAVRFGNVRIVVDRLEGRRIDRVWLRVDAADAPSAESGDSP